MNICARYLFITLFFWISEISGQSTVSISTRIDTTLSGLDIPVKININSGSKPDSISFLLVNYDDYLSHHTIINDMKIVDFEISDFGKWQGNLNTIMLNQEQSETENTLKLKIWDEGKFIVFPIINAQKELNFDSISIDNYPIIYVKPSIDPNDSIRTLAPTKDIIREEKRLADHFAWYHFLIIFLLLIVIAVFIFNKYKKRAKNNFPDEKPSEIALPHIAALEKLNVLKLEKIWLKDRVKEFHEQLTYILREYFEKKYEINALEQSTTEIINSIEDNIEDKNHLNNIKDILQIADLIKFAKAKIDEDLNEKFLNKTIDLINTLQ